MPGWVHMMDGTVGRMALMEGPVVNVQVHFLSWELCSSDTQNPLSDRTRMEGKGFSSKLGLILANEKEYVKFLTILKN